MLIELRIRSFAVIEEVALTLEPGLNVLTGETGAGKSIIVGALSLLLGERASSEVVRPGADRAVVEGVFDISGQDGVAEVLTRAGLEPEEGLLILRREVALEGRNRAWVNGSSATATLVGELGRHLVDLHGQHEHQTLLKAAEQRDILDRYAGAADERERVARAHDGLMEVRGRLRELEERRRDAESRTDFLRFQSEEIESADLRPDEIEELDAEARRLEHAEELARLADQLHRGLYADNEAVASLLASFRDTLARLARIDPSLQDDLELLESAYHGVEEVGRRMGGYAEGVAHDPARLERIHERQALIHRLCRKYGGELADVVEVGRRARAELDSLETVEFDRRALARDESAAAVELESAAAALTELRAAAGARLAEEVCDLLPALGLPGGRFEANRRSLPEIGPAGAEAVEFLVSLNEGFEPRPLDRVASGGELSRIMLALKTVLARVDDVASLIFDEVDSGIGGPVGNQVGRMLREVAGAHQVFAITHLPQIASRAHHHLLVKKVEGRGISRTEVVELADEERVRELARMLGDPDSGASLEHARGMLATP